ncbi:Gene 25-like lysozyme [Caballeronia calidae]|uniref:Gene 25-like lysozyme n=1 Tax=Caballeronia calidae TaxID=1777139 RepID=A0A158EG26_9BURK|nr:GPW/gp25 family protein [Caballeronia calidae]SAL04857.1 Gene 25-like lysozyme [Caballeronia calidae]
MSWMAFPFAPRHGRTLTRDDDGHVRDMLELVLFTAPGERVNQPDFGCGLNRLLFAGAAPELAGALDMSMRGAIQRWLGDVLAIQELSVEVSESTVTLELTYSLRASGKNGSARFERRLT